MKKLALALFVVVAAVVTINLTPEPASTGKYPDHFLAKSVTIQFAPKAQAASVTRGFEYLLSSVTTTTFSNNNRTAIATFSTGTESAPSGAAVGLDLTNISGVSVILKTVTTNATAGGTLQAYTYNPETAAWNRVPDLDLTAIASTGQSWPAIWVPVSRGRVTWVPNGIGTANGVVYIVGQPKN